MEKVVIKPGIILLKKDGIIYEIDKRTLHTIKGIVFDIDCDICKSCKNTMCRDSKQIDESFIKDALTLKTKDHCDIVFSCTRHETEDEDYARRLVWYSPSQEEMSIDENTTRHYGDAHVHHIVHPTIKKHIDRI